MMGLMELSGKSYAEVFEMGVRGYLDGAGSHWVLRMIEGQVFVGLVDQTVPWNMLALLGGDEVGPFGDRPIQVGENGSALVLPAPEHIRLGELAPYIVIEMDKEV